LVYLLAHQRRNGLESGLVGAFDFDFLRHCCSA
jgi:hypothetical protein